MSNEVTQWIAEIKALREQLAEAHRDRDAALDSVAHWSQLYNREAEQRRAETKASQQAIELLKAEIQQLKADFAGRVRDSTDGSATSLEIETLQSWEECKQKLIEISIERDRLLQALQAEQASHAKTRQNLTTALGDTIDLITKHKSIEAVEAEVMPAKPTKTEPAKLPPPPQSAPLPSVAKSPSLQLPPTRPAPPRF